MTKQSAFNWQGQPSIFTTGSSPRDFDGVNTRRSEMQAANQGKKGIIVRKKDALVTGGKLGKK